MSARAAAHVALVALLRLAGLEAPGVADRVERDGVHEVLARALGASASLLPEDPAPRLADARAEIARWQSAGLRLLTVLDDDYPPNLRTVHDRPALLFLAGDLTLARKASAIGVVGTRRPSAGGLAAGARMASELVAAGQVVLSGLAAGIDTAAHRAALEARGATIAVLGTGHGHAYPPQNTVLQAELVRDHAVISPFWPETGPSAARFRRRNGVMSGLSRGTVIVEASARSGTRVQARLALAHGRPVFLLRPLLGQTWAVELARRPGVHVVDGAADVLGVLEGDPGELTGPTE